MGRRKFKHNFDKNEYLCIPGSSSTMSFLSLVQNRVTPIYVPSRTSVQFGGFLDSRKLGSSGMPSEFSMDQEWISQSVMS